MVLVGDSAGGGLAAAVALQVAGEDLVQHAVLFSPWLDLGRENPRTTALDAVDRGLAAPGLR